MGKTKLDWTYHDDGEYRADYKGLILRAVRDDCPENPFEAWDGHWPMRFLYARSVTDYDEKLPGTHINAPIARFSDHLLVHLQVHIAKALDADGHSDLRYHLDAWPDDEPAPRWTTDVDALRSWFNEAYDGWDTGASKLDMMAELYGLLDIPCLRHTSRGYCQGDWAELLIVATPEAVKALRPDATPDELKADMERQASLYDAWAWGDVYGYVVCREIPADDPDDEPELEELDSCWGYYGSEFDESGLEDAAIDAAEHQVAQNARQLETVSTC